MNNKKALVSHLSAFVLTGSLIRLQLSILVSQFVFTCLHWSLIRLDSSLLVWTGLSFVYTRLYLSGQFPHSSALVSSLVCNISNIIILLYEIVIS